ncbi:glycosyltransferase family 9 protein [Geomonas sp. Red32]|uniref:glycosyltransferase family 9 protein n=1 Tax=Geomonas sp. Red32 TaxID=2912856 RepID=UPI00202CF872|nr:glycosyltransferase family 9 protein [Geomonas sp. Red32]MCM0082803.1 glycosyltransferase family 9 protein [Geomonas sp. Red32]
MMTPAPKSILIVNIRLIGDVILTTPLIGLLHEAYPEAAIDLLVDRGTGEYLERDPRVRKVLYREKGKRGGGYLGTIFRSYDLAINLNASDRGNLAVLLAGKRMRVGFYDGNAPGKDFWKKLLLERALLLPTETHTARTCALIAETLGISAGRLEVKVCWNADDEAKVLGLLAGRGVSGRFFVVHPFARWIYKYWRSERFAELSDAVHERYGLTPVWSCSPSPAEKEELLRLAGLCKTRPVLVEGELNLSQLTFLLSRASLYLGLDTAISHLAASVGVPMVALYGPTFTKRWFPWNNKGGIDQRWGTPAEPGSGHCIVVQKEMPCVPCGLAGCDDTGQKESPCLIAVTLDEVLEAVRLLEPLFAEEAAPNISPEE